MQLILSLGIISVEVGQSKEFLFGIGTQQLITAYNPMYTKTHCFTALPMILMGPSLIILTRESVLKRFMWNGLIQPPTEYV